jgi:beta-N-acetylhexosaminidase
MTSARQFSRRAAAGVAGLAAAGALAGAGTAFAAPPTLRQRAGQRVIFSYPGLTPPESLLRHIRAGEAAGVIFFGENISSVAQLAGVARQLNAAAAHRPSAGPLLLMTDQEGGRVRRLPGAPEASAKQVGLAADPVAAARASGAGAGANLRHAGLNVNLAPVLDVYRTPGNFIDAPERSYSGNPAKVARLASAFVAEQRKTGVASTVKHFPGLGAAPAGANTDLQPVVLDQSLSTLHNVDEAPYPAAIGAGAQLVMLSWAVYPALDRDRPAGLSPAVVQGELRGRLGYRGVTVTDALEAGSLARYGSAGRRATLAASAGVDLLLASARDVGQGEQVVAGLADALRSGGLGDGAFTAATGRVNALRRSLR